MSVEALAANLTTKRPRARALTLGRDRLMAARRPDDAVLRRFLRLSRVVPARRRVRQADARQGRAARRLRSDEFHPLLHLPQYYNSALLTIEISVVSSIIAAILGYPLAYLIAKVEHPTWNTVLMILVLASMQLDGVIRLYGMMVLLGDNGLINGTLIRWHTIDKPLPLMYNVFGVIVGTVQITLPFMVLSLIGVIRGISPSFEEAARSLGASPMAGLPDASRCR